MVFTQVNGKWRKAGTSYASKTQSYMCYMTDEPPLESLIWARKAEFLDALVIDHFKRKFIQTFEPAVWGESIEAAAHAVREQTKSKRKQLQAVEGMMRNLEVSLEALSEPMLIRRIEERFIAARNEHERLTRELTETGQEIAQLNALADLQGKCGPALENWPNLSADEQRSILHAFIDRIEVVPLEGQALRVILYWRDGTLEEAILARKGTTYTTWHKQEEITLQMLIHQGASQVEIAATFPYRTWEMIRQKYSSLKGGLIPLSGPQPIHDQETYEAYLQRIGDGTVPYQARAGERWNPKDVERLLQLLESGAAQLDIAAAFPHRNWKRIRAKISELRGSDFRLPGPRRLRSHETYELYRLRVASANDSE
jgi:hypothetical protein